MKIMPFALRAPVVSVTPVLRPRHSTIQSRPFAAHSGSVSAFGLAIPRRREQNPTAPRVEIHLQKSPY